MKPIALCAALAASGRDALRRVRHRVTFVAYAICVAMTISPLYADVQTLTWNGASGAAWTAGENWLDGETPSAWIGGASASFGAGASGTLTLSGNATINLGDGALSFADSHAETWAAGATLNIVGTGSLSRKPIRFGTNSSGLTAAQLKQIRYNGDKVSLTG